jgi:phosphoglycerol transferase MdoB-like AlkP superfamily enzyme
MSKTFSRLGPLSPFIYYSLLLISLFLLSRLILMGWLAERIGSLDNALKIIAFGLRFDVIVICLIWFIPAVILLLLPKTLLLNKVQSFIARVWLSLSTAIMVFLEISTPAFIDQYDTRPNRIFFEYLNNPVEVLKTSVLEYPWHFVVALILMYFLIRYLIRFNQRIFSELKPWPVWLRVLFLPCLLALLVLGARSSLDHRPANASTAAFSNDQLLNTLGLSSTYTVFNALYNLKNESSDNSIYGRMDEKEMVSIVREQSMIPPDQFIDDDLSTWHQQTVQSKPKKFNLVIILQESLGAGFVGKLGGIGVTPEIDKLADQGLWFEQMYATGTRSARGIEAVVAGYPPSPSRSVLKLGLAQQNFSTLASILKGEGYQNQFIYGGQSSFDNMAGFFLSNGFDKVTDQEDFLNPMFRGTWGVSDEDLLQRVDQQLQQADPTQPQFILAFTSSNHSPFDFPDNKIELFDSEKQTVNNAVKYADYAVGQFFKTAKQRDYWKDTYFLLVADHDTRVFGASLVPIKKFHIPALIIGPDLEPSVYTPVASQIDLAPTLLSLMGLTTRHPMIGHDVTQTPKGFPGRALMQYSNNHAYRYGDKVVIHQPEKQPQQFQYIDGKFIEEAIDAELLAKAKAHALWPMYAYREMKYLQIK